MLWVMTFKIDCISRVRKSGKGILVVRGANKPTVSDLLAEIQKQGFVELEDNMGKFLCTPSNIGNIYDFESKRA